MLGELIPAGGGDAIPLLKPKLLIGRRDSCDICLRFPNVSNRHCTLEMVNGFWRVHDLGSSNGTKVNGERVDVKWVFPGDEVCVAKHAFTIQYTPLSDERPPEDETPKMSLLEKAGLTGPKSSSHQIPTVKPNPSPSRPSSSPPSPPRGKSTDDQVVEWLFDDKPSPERG